jgi:quercetin dioxygenase-like cupin family protein
MFSRRMFTGCALCAAIGFVADDASAQTPSGFKRSVIGRIAGPAEGYETLQLIVDIEPNVVIDWRNHPGTEAAYTLDGVGELRIKG